MSYVKHDIAASRRFWAVTWIITMLMVLISTLFIILSVIR